jgi:hypothetical protein
MLRVFRVIRVVRIIRVISIMRSRRSGVMLRCGVWSDVEVWEWCGSEWCLGVVICATVEVCVLIAASRCLFKFLFNSCD